MASLRDLTKKLAEYTGTSVSWGQKGIHPQTENDPNFQVQTDKLMMANQPVIVVVEKQVEGGHSDGCSITM